MAELGAIERLIELVEEDTGALEIGGDDEPVGWQAGEPMEMTFGDVRRARAELEALKKKPE